MNITPEQIKTALVAFFSTPEMLPAGGYSVTAEYPGRGYWEVTIYTPAGVDFQSFRVAVEVKNGKLEFTHHAYRAPIGTAEIPAA
jgi:hypothetical protein